MLSPQRVSQQAPGQDQRHSVDEDVPGTGIEAPHFRIAVIQIDAVQVVVADHGRSRRVDRFRDGGVQRLHREAIHSDAKKIVGRYPVPQAAAVLGAGHGGSGRHGSQRLRARGSRRQSAGPPPGPCTGPHSGW
jgi:hypothetical protein